MNEIRQNENVRKQIKHYRTESREERHTHPKLLKLEINEQKITAYLEDKREISIPVSELAKGWCQPNLKAEQLKNYEIDPWGFRLHFPEADIDTCVLVFTGYYCGCC